MIDRRLLAVLLAGAAGCMRIYPDPELPDVIVEWDRGCGDDGVTVRISAVSPDGTEVTQDAPCADGKGRVEDLERTSHTITSFPGRPRFFPRRSEPRGGLERYWRGRSGLVLRFRL